MLYMVRKFYPPIQTPCSTILFYRVTLSMIGIHSVANDKSFVLREVVIIRCLVLMGKAMITSVIDIAFLLLLKVLAYKRKCTTHKILQVLFTNHLLDERIYYRREIPQYSTWSKDICLAICLYLLVGYFWQCFRYF